MIYFYCSECGLKFRKSQPTETACLRCGSTDLWEEDIPKSEITDADDMIEEMVREKYARK